MIMKKLLFIFAFSFAFFNQVKVDVMANDDPIVLNEKIDNPIGAHEDPGKSPTTINVYQNGSTFYFGESYIGCAVTLQLNNVVVYSDMVGIDGTVSFPESFSGTFELILTVGTTVYGAFVTL